MNTEQPEARELNAVLDELLRLGDEAPRTIAGRDEDVLAVGHGWFMRSLRSLRGARLLDANGLGVKAAPLVRTAIEHGVGLGWLAANGSDAVQVLRREHKAWAARVDKATADAGGWERLTREIFDEIAGVELPKIADHGKTKTKFTSTQQLDLYVAWLSETANSRATLASSAAYMSGDERGRYNLLATPLAAAGRDIAEQCAVTAVDAVHGMAEVLEAEEWKRRAQALEAWLEAVLSERFGGKEEDGGESGPMGQPV